MRKSKKSKFRSVTINKKRYYFYTIKWLDITGDSGHATEEEMLKLQPSKMVSQAYIFKKDSKSIWTFASYDETDAQFSDRNVFPIGCIISLEKIKV
jgi:hypothetical protein